jgi:hypothetical protein
VAYFTVLFTPYMREAVLPGLLELNKTIITICSAAIILTITLIDKFVNGKNYLMVSWFALITCKGLVSLYC